MKYYLKVFLISFVCFALLIGGGVFAMTKFNLLGMGNTGGVGETANTGNEQGDQPSSALAEKFNSGDRVNVLVIGTDGGRSDTLMVFSYDTKNKLADIISIPRDTYNHIEGKNAADQRKINAVYGFKGEAGGVEGLKKEVSKILGVPISFYVELDYEAVAKVVDTVGGIEVEIPYELDYDDPTAKPELHIHFQPGLQTIEGQHTWEYLRWRKNNNGKHSMGDLERIKRQQEFVVKVAKKAIGFKLPFVVNDVFSYLKTDMNIGDMIYIGTKAIGMDFESIQKHTIPGEAGMKLKASYYFHDAEKTYQLMKEIYERVPVTEALPGEATPSTEDNTKTNSNGTSN